MKKGQMYSGSVREVKFPNKGIVEVDPYTEANDENAAAIRETCIVKNTIKGQKVSFVVNKKKGGRCEGRLVEVLSKSPDECEPACRHFGACGGCTYQNLPYEKQLEMKEDQVKALLAPVVPDLEEIFEGIKGSPVQFEYRNKMEFSFGDSCKGGDLELGLHKRGSFYDILSVKDCRIVDEDYRVILAETLAYFRGKDTPFYHKLTHEGYLRHLLVRKAVKTGEILVDLVTSSQEPAPTMCTEVSLIDDWLDIMLTIEKEGRLKGSFVGILHTVNDSLSDTIMNDKTDILYGRDHFYEEILGLKFKISPFSFFQTNSLSAEVLYDTARGYVLSCLKENSDEGDFAENDKEDLNGVRKPVVYDLYSGTGTIAQLLAPVADKVVGVEIVEEAVVAARENAKLNGLHNCEFIAGDVLKVLDDIEDKPDLIVLDPPRDGVNPKALKKIINYGVDNILYISCKPTSLARDLEMLTACGYKPVRICAIDQFPATVHVETVVCLGKNFERPKEFIQIGIDAEEYYRIKDSKKEQK
ncbi:MAG: 23S rRNA (uracil(1939)-C(5))-methyltransferase RlmD [Lachnospiraceae bacterium]|nr:23S rRNA (uracil(1939)-C(5))-methyltransferase RlmD [Lachnospiraceae bacterium]